MKNRDVLVLILMIAPAVLSGCATLGIPQEGTGKTAAEATTPAAIPGPVGGQSQISRLESFMALELALEKAKGPKVEVSRKLLEDLLRAEQAYKMKCDRLSLQLEALKSIDAADPRGMKK